MLDVNKNGPKNRFEKAASTDQLVAGNVWTTPFLYTAF